VTASPASAAVGQSITFTFATLSDTQATQLTLGWNFGDGVVQTPAAQTVQHSYSAANTYTVTGSVADNAGHTNCATTTVIIGGGSTGTGSTGTSTNPRLPVAPNGPYTGNVNQPISFSGFAQSQNGGTITSYTWAFGDGGSATGQTVQHTYTSAGTFTVTLTATDSTGQTSSNTTTATVGGTGTSGSTSGTATTGQNSERGVTVNTGGPYTGTAGTAINFSATATTTNPGATITSYSWSFGDGAAASGQTTSHAYSSSGNYTLTLTATDSTGVAVAATATVVIGGSGSSSTPRTVQLTPGCNNVALTFPDNTPTTTVANGVSPASALLSVWKMYDPQNQKYHAFFPGATQATDLPSVNRLDAVFICVNAAATLTEPGA
jgi:PKD repeat protein